MFFNIFEGFGLVSYFMNFADYLTILSFDKWDSYGRKMYFMQELL